MNERLLQQAIDLLEDALNTLSAMDGLPHQREARKALLEQQIRTAQTRVRLARTRSAQTVDIKPRVDKPTNITYARGRTVIE